MIRLFQFLLHGCWHAWKSTGGTVDHYDISFGPRHFMYRYHIQRCAKCGRYGGYKERRGAPSQ